MEQRFFLTAIIVFSGIALFLVVVFIHLVSKVG